MIHIVQFIEEVVFQYTAARIDFRDLAAHHPADDVQIMYTHIHKQTAALRDIVGGRSFGISAAVMDIDGLTAFAAFDHLFSGHVSRVVPAHIADHDKGVVSFNFFYDLLRLVKLKGNGLFTEDRLSAGNCRHQYLIVSLGRRCNDNGFHFRVIDQIMVVCIYSEIRFTPF